MHSGVASIVSVSASSATVEAAAGQANAGGVRRLNGARRALHRRGNTAAAKGRCSLSGTKVTGPTLCKASSALQTDSHLTGSKRQRSAVWTAPATNVKAMRFDVGCGVTVAAQLHIWCHTIGEGDLCMDWINAKTAVEADRLAWETIKSAEPSSDVSARQPTPSGAAD
jgi:hypothetical protein